MERLRILIVDDEPSIRTEIEEFLVAASFTVFQAGLPSEAFAILEREPVDICVLDIRLPEMNGLEVLAKIKQSHPSVEIIIITAHGEMESVISAMRLGAVDFFNKPFMLKDLDRAIRKTKAFIHFQHLKTTDTNGHTLIKPEVQQLIGQKIICESRQMKDLIRTIHNIASVENSNVLITGESGTGKELLAKGIHYLSQRARHPFCPVNCASIPEELFESEFFGHTKGAFTGAFHEKAGWFETANHGSLFLDEIGDMKLSTQPKLLRVLDDMNVVRVGSTKKIPIDVRIIAASNHNLERLIEEKLFRLDLYYRLNTITLHIPPLRERKADILPLFYNFLNDYAASINKPINEVAPNVIDWIQDYHFPGNIRELKHLVERAIILSHDHTITLNHFIHPGSPGKTAPPPLPSGPTNLYELEKQTIIQTLKKARYIKVQAARLLNISRQALDRKIEKYGIPVSWKQN
ncbi:MAG: sigma-54 dependent transcriptional regulator [Bacteroidetes bacterium]|nr:sigma-54 dependent transcriptional regulator [Bacteroidota bacterium]